MNRFLLSFILCITAFTSAIAEKYTGIQVTNSNGQKIYYLFEEKPTVKYVSVEGVTNACLYVMGKAEPVVSIPMKGGAKLSLRYDTCIKTQLNNAGFATFSCTEQSYVATEGVQAYKASVKDNTVTLTALNGNIPAGTGVVLYGENPGTDVYLPVATSGTVADVSDNELKPTIADDGSLVELEANSWMLDDDKFLQYMGAAYMYNCAYLVLPEIIDTEALKIVFASDDPTAITDVTSGKASAHDGKYIGQGNIIIIKDGKKYNVAGQIIK